MSETNAIEGARSRRRQVADLEKMVKFGQLSSEGRNWLIQAMDPFHDSEVPVTGYPDMVTTPSVCQAIRQSITITVPTTVTTGTWDCNIAAFPAPYASGTTALPVAITIPGIYTTATSTMTPYVNTGVTSFAGPTSTQGYGTTSNQWQLTGGVAIPTPYTAGPMRVVGYGVEVINTTSALNCQGLCTVWRQSCPVRNLTTVGLDHSVGGGVVPTSWASAFEMPQPPGTLANAQLLEGSKQWHAKEGAYLVNTMADISNPPQQAEPFYVTTVGAENQVGNTTLRQAMCSLPQNTYATTVQMPAPQMVAPYHMVGAYFTGLSLQTTLTVNTIWYVERFPTPFDNNLVVLTSPSPAFDPVALELYGLALQRMPAGVMVKENPFGEWFQDLIHNIAEAAAPALSAASTALGATPYGMAFGAASGFANMVSKSTARAPARQKATQQQKQKQKQRGIAQNPTPQKPVPAQPRGNQTRKRNRNRKRQLKDMSGAPGQYFESG